MTCSDDEDHLLASDTDTSVPSDKEPPRSPVSAPLVAVRKKFSRKTTAAFPPAQESYLLTFVPSYLEKCRSFQGRGPRGIGGTKGKKGAYIVDTIIPAFTEEFATELEGRDKKEVEQSIKRFMYNRSGTTRRHAEKRVVVVQSSSKKPRKTDPVRLYTAQNKKTVGDEIQRRAKAEAIHRDYRLEFGQKLKNEIFNKLPADEQERFTREAEEANRALAKKPPHSYLHQNQIKLPAMAADALNSLSGEDWGQCGDFVYFTMGAYRSQADGVKLFYFCGGTDEASTADSSFLRNPTVGVMKASFTEWAYGVLPGSEEVSTKGKSRANPAIPRDCIILSPEREPLLPEIDFKLMKIDKARQLLKDYIRFAWVYELYGPGGCPEGEDEILPPWDALHSLSEGHYLADLRLFLAPPNNNSHDSGLSSSDSDSDSNPHAYTPLYSSLNPQLCSDEDVIQLLKDIFRCQHDHDIRLLAFKLNDSDRAQLRRSGTLPERFSPRVQSPIHATGPGEAADDTAVAEAQPPKLAISPATSSAHFATATVDIEHVKLSTPTAAPSTHVPNPKLVKLKGKRGRKPASGKAKSTKSQNAKTVVVGSSKAPRQRKPPPPPREGSRRIHSENYDHAVLKTVRAPRQA